VYRLPSLPARLTVREKCVSPMRLGVYLGATVFHISLISVSFLWEQWYLWHESPLSVPSLMLSFVTAYLSAFFCGFIATMADPQERHNLTLNAIAPLHESLLGPRAHLRAKAPLKEPGFSRDKALALTASANGGARPQLTPHPLRGLLPKSEWPRVAIIVPCYKEPDDIIAATIGGCLRQVYPSARLHVYLLDDNQNQCARPPHPRAPAPPAARSRRLPPHLPPTHRLLAPSPTRPLTRPLPPFL
jgi:hypothetical protein